MPWTVRIYSHFFSNFESQLIRILQINLHNIGFCICVCGVWTRLCGYMHECACGNKRVTMGIFLNTVLPCLFLLTKSLIKPRPPPWLDWLTSKSQGSFWLSSLGLTDMLHHAHTFTCVLEDELRLVWQALYQLSQPSSSVHLRGQNLSLYSLFSV